MRMLSKYIAGNKHSHNIYILQLWHCNVYNETIGTLFGRVSRCVYVKEEGVTL